MTKWPSRENPQVTVTKPSTTLTPVVKVKKNAGALRFPTSYFSLYSSPTGPDQVTLGKFSYTGDTSFNIKCTELNFFQTL